MIYHDPKETLPKDSEGRQIMRFVAESAEYREEFSVKWEETLSNYCVIPYNQSGWSGEFSSGSYKLGGTSNPLNQGYRMRDNGLATGATLKDPETHQIIETLLASLWSMLFGVPGYIRSGRVGQEDLPGSVISNKLLDYSLQLPGHPRVFYEWLKSGLIFGTGMMEGYWHYQIGEVLDRRVSAYGLTEVAETFSKRVAVYDDPKLRVVDNMDFFPDPTCPLMSDMYRCAKRFHVSPHIAEGREDWDQAAVRRAIENNQVTDSQEQEDQSWREGYDRPPMEKSRAHPSPLVGYQYFGWRPWVKKGSPWGVTTIVSGEIVKRSKPEKPWPFKSERLPFFDFTVNPIAGRFYGLAPADVNRYSQDFADSLLMNIAAGVAKAVRPPQIYNKNMDVDISKLRHWRPDVPVGANSTDAVRQLEYNPPVAAAFSVFQTLKTLMRDGSGASSPVQGLGLGSDRASATEASATFQRAGARIDMMASLIEQENLPPIGKFLIELFQVYVEDPQEIIDRIGNVDAFFPLSELNTVRDVRFIGSRLTNSKRDQLNNIERFVGVWAKTPVAALLPWQKLMAIHARALEQPELEALVGDPQVVQTNLLLQQLSGPNKAGGNGNNEQVSLPPSGMTQEQLSGGLA